MFQNNLHLNKLFYHQALYLIATNGTPEIQSLDQISDEFKDFLFSCLEIDADKRKNATQLLQVKTLFEFIDGIK